MTREASHAATATPPLRAASKLAEAVSRGQMHCVRPSCCKESQPGCHTSGCFGPAFRRRSNGSRRPGQARSVGSSRKCLPCCLREPQVAADGPEPFPRPRQKRRSTSALRLSCWGLQHTLEPGVWDLPEQCPTPTAADDATGASASRDRNRYLHGALNDRNRYLHGIPIVPRPPMRLDTSEIVAAKDEVLKSQVETDVSVEDAAAAKASTSEDDEASLSELASTDVPTTPDCTQEELLLLSGEESSPTPDALGSRPLPWSTSNEDSSPSQQQLPV